MGSTRPPRRCDRLIPSPLSCVRMRPAPPVARTRPLDCLAQVARRLLPAPTRGTLIRVRPLNHRLTQPAPDTTPAATLLARLFLSCTTAVTWAGRVGVLARQVCPGLPPRHSFRSRRGTDFRGKNTEASPYPPWPGFAASACVSAIVDWQGLDAPFIVELFTVCFSRQNPGGGQPPVPRCCHREAPDASAR